MIFLLLGRIVVTLLTLCTCQCDPHAHNFHLQFVNDNAASGKINLRRPDVDRQIVAIIRRQFLGIKKRPISSPIYYIIPFPVKSIYNF